VGWIVGWKFAFPYHQEDQLFTRIGVFSSGWITSGLLVIQQESAAGGYAQIMACQKSLVPHVGTADDLFRASGRAPHPEGRCIPCRAS
jgi:hypothetical protein